MTYEKFIESKSQIGGMSGFAPLWMPDFLFDFQKSLVEWAIRKGKAAIFADCGLGKTPMQLVWAQNIVEKMCKPVLILTPLSVAPQTVREASKFGIECKQSRDGKVAAPITVTNYQQLHKFDSNDFSGVVCDECFAPNTLVECVENGMVFKKYISTIKPNEIIINASGRDRVIERHRREIDRAIKIEVGGKHISASENHPFFTQRGWVASIELTPGDYVMETPEAMRLVSCGVCSEVPGIVGYEVLRDILFSEMENAPAGDCGESSQSRSCQTQGRVEVEMVCGGQPSGGKGAGAYSQFEPNDTPRSASKSQPDIASDEVQTFRAWRKWDRDDEAAAVALGGLTRRMGSGVCLVTWPKTCGLSDLLQNGFGTRREENLHRGGWQLPSFEKGNGCQENSHAGFVRVDGIEVLEPGHPELEQWRDASGVIYFYDLKAARHPSYSVNGLLVHNSSILKNFDGVLKSAITEFMRRLPYRSLWTATAAPNDYIELGTSSEALGDLGFMDMLNRFFKKAESTTSRSDEFRSGVYRFRGHAQHDFWRWVCSWARAVRQPSDLGFSNERYVLPELRTIEHVVRAVTPRDGWLIDLPAITLEEQRSERRRTIKERCEMAASLIANTGKPAVAWCHLNDEGKLLERLIPGAVEVEGNDSDEFKEETFEAFSAGEIRVMVSKPVIAAFGLNWQHCAHETFFPSHSFEQWYQSVRRCWRFGQKNPVTVDIIASEGEAGVLSNLNRKALAAETMFARLVELINNELRIEQINRCTKPEEIPSWL